MCYLIAKDINRIGSIAVQMEHGKHLVDFKAKIIANVGYDSIQLVTISRPSAYGEYEPYVFATSEQDFEQKVYTINKYTKTI